MKYLFIDDALTERAEHATIEVNSPAKLGPITDLNKPRTGDRGAYGSVIQEPDGQVRLWGAGFEKFDERWEVYQQYSETHDGLTWWSPMLSIYKLGRRRLNNVVLKAPPEGNVFKDPNDEAFPYKYVYFVRDKGLEMLKSPNGIDWIYPPRLLETKAHRDSQNVFFWDDRIGKYVGYLRGWKRPLMSHDDEKHRLRLVERIEFDSFADLVAKQKGQPRRLLSEGEVVLDCDDYDPPDSDLYTSAVVQYEPEVYLAFPSMFRHVQIGDGYDFRELPNEGFLETQIATSRDGISWTRFRQPYFPVGAYGEVDSCTVYMWTGLARYHTHVLQFYSGNDTTHRGNPLFSIREMGDIYAIMALRQRRDGFVGYLNRDYLPAYVLSKPFTFNGFLDLNFDAGASGWVKCELIDDAGHRTMQKVSFCGNWMAKRIEFCEDVRSWAGRTVQLKINFQNAWVFGWIA